jgi:hypothetical protein
LKKEKTHTIGEKIKDLPKPHVMGSCFCGKPAVIHAFDTNFCQQHNDELAKSFEARMKLPDNDFDGGGGA